MEVKKHIQSVPVAPALLPPEGTCLRNRLLSLWQSSNWVRSSSRRTSDTECSLQLSPLKPGLWLQCVWDSPSVVSGPVRRAGTWAAWRRRAAGRICWWTLLPPNRRERACRGRYTPRVSQPAENNNNMSDTLTQTWSKLLQVISSLFVHR